MSTMHICTLSASPWRSHIDGIKNEELDLVPRDNKNIWRTEISMESLKVEEDSTNSEDIK